jgi:hypothetical protein
LLLKEFAREFPDDDETPVAPGPVIAGPAQGAKFLDRQPPPHEQRRKRRAHEEEGEHDDGDFGADDRQGNEDGRKRERREPVTQSETRISDRFSRMRMGNVHHGKQYWTEEQTQTLIDYIAEHGPQWARIRNVSNTTLPVKN